MWYNVHVCTNLYKKVQTGRYGMDERQGTGLDTTNNQWSDHEQDRFSQRPGKFRSVRDVDYTEAAENDGMSPMGDTGIRRTMPGQNNNGARNIKKFEIDSLRDAGRARMKNMRDSEANSTQGARPSDSDFKRNVRPSRIDNVQKTRFSEMDSNQDANAAGENGIKDVGKRRVDRQRNTGIEGRKERYRPNSRGTRRYSRARRRRRNLILRIVLAVILLIAVIGGVLFWKKYGPSKEEADLKQYYGMADENDLAVIINNEVIKDDEGILPVGKLIDGQPYIEYSVVRHHINERFYWDPNESIMLYTLPNGNVSVSVGSKEYTEINEKKSENYAILKTEGRTAYIALPFIQKYTNLDFSVYENPNRAAITCEWGDIQTASVKKSTEIRYQGGVKSPILTKIEKSDKVVVLEDEGNWKKIATADGFVGYVKNNTLRKAVKETTSRKFIEPEYSNMSVNKTINMAWHSVDNPDANSYMLETIADTKGLTTIAPTWFSIADTDGNIQSISSSDYVNYAHQQNLDVWAVLRDFHGGINSYEETYNVLSYTSKRESLINQVIAEALRSGIDGINLDFELVSLECGEHYIQFVRELSVKCRQNGLVFSVNNYVPQPYNEYYNLKEQSIMADYIMIMGYDEHTEGSYEAGSVASYGYVKQGIEDALKYIPHEKLVAGIPFYTRLWQETEKTPEEKAEEEGTEAAAYPNKVTSTAMGMDEANQILEQYGVQASWDDKTKQNYAQWEADGGVYKIWLEDEKSLEEKMKLIKSENLAGVAEWSLGSENSSVWDMILQYVN